MNRARNTNNTGNRIGMNGNMGNTNMNNADFNGNLGNMGTNNGYNGNSYNMNGMQNGTTNGMNNRTNMNGTVGGVTQNGTGLGKEALYEQIRALGFVKVELELYLDTHPNCRTAIDYYFQTVAALQRLTEEYEARFGPLTAAGVTSNENWTWVNSPWPWHRADENMDNNWTGEAR